MFLHFFKGKDKELGDFIYFQGHASPGIYSRAFIEGRLNEEQANDWGNLELTKNQDKNEKLIKN